MITRGKTGVLLLNLGTPDSPTARDVRNYLAEFLSDRRIVDLPAWRWKPILHGIILRTRPAKSAAKYASIWTEAGSPLMMHSRALCDILKNELDEIMPEHYIVRFAMRYGNPSIPGMLDELVRIGVDKILVIPLYPQYSSTTTASALDAVYQWGMGRHYIPEFRFVNNYHDMLEYIDVLCEQIVKHWKEHDRGEKLLISFHSVPQRLIDEGDPYQQQCLKTAELLARALKLGEEEYLVTYQSRFGKEKWLEPATQETLECLAKEGVKSVDVICPGFSVDCLETLEEIDIECREAFLKSGGERFQYIPCLNAEHVWGKVLGKMVKHHARSWEC